MAKRKLTPDFKATVVLESSGESSQAELCRHNLSEEQLSKWKQQFVENAASLCNRAIRLQRILRNALRTSNSSLGG